jgi:hypothetical protein
MWSGQRPGLQDISGGANFANKADNGLVVHRDWARLKELRERDPHKGAAGKAAGKAPAQGDKRARKDKDSGAAAEAEGEGEEVKDDEGLDYTEFEAQIWVEKVRRGLRVG